MVASTAGHSVGYFYEPTTLRHDPPRISAQVGSKVIAFGSNFVANALLTQQIDEVLEATGNKSELVELTAPHVERSLLEKVHARSYLDDLEAACASSSTTFDMWSPVSPATWDAALTTAGMVARAVELVMSGSLWRAVVNGRPAGHHATRDEAMGACYINDVAVGVEAALEHGCERVMIVDWDVHTGNGAERLFWDRPDVLNVSLHQESWYPDPRESGRADMVGGHDAMGRTVNVPLPAATNDAGYRAALDRLVLPMAREFRPELIILAAGQDCSFYDGQGRNMVTMDGFREMAQTIGGLADELCAGRVVTTLQGGYAPVYTPFCATAVIEGIANSPIVTPDPFDGDSEWLVCRRPVEDRVLSAIADVVAAHRPFWGADVWGQSTGGGDV